MGIFGQSSPFDADIEKATSETNTNDNWSYILDVCDKVTTNPRSAKDCLKSIMKRMGHADPHVVMQAITLLDACTNNCGKLFHLEIASRDFETEFRRLLSKAQPKVSLKMRQVLKNWAENDFKNDPELNLIPSLYIKLRHEGYDFSNLNEKPAKAAAKAAISKDPNVVNSQQEEDDIAKAIELSLKEVKSSPKQLGSSSSNGGAGGGGGGSTTAYPSLYPSFPPSSGVNATGGGATNSSVAVDPGTQPEPRKVRALYDFEAAEENELTFFAGEIIHVLDDSDANWWKGFNQRGDGLFPSNFVTADLSVDPDRLDINQQHKASKKSEDDARELQQKTEAAAAAAANQPIEIDEGKIDRLLHLLHEANPEDPSQDSEEMLRLEQEVHQMGPLIDAELERVDRKHAQLTQLSSDLVDAINLYHSLMRDDRAGLYAATLPGMPGYGPSSQIMYGPPVSAGYLGANGNFAVGPSSLGQQNFGSGMQSLPFANAGHLPSNAGPGAYQHQQPPTATQSQPQSQLGHVPMQFQNGHSNGLQLNSLPSHMAHGQSTQQEQQQQQTQLQQMFVNPTPSTQQQPQPNYQILPAEQQQQFAPQSIASSTTVGGAQQLPPPPPQQQQQHQQQSHQTPVAPPLQQQQQFMSPQHQQQHLSYIPQQSTLPNPYTTLPNGPQPFMSPPPHGPMAGVGNNMMGPPPPSISTTHQPLPTMNNHIHTSNSNTNQSIDQFSQLQHQMAAMSMGLNQPQPLTQNFLVQNEAAKNSIPIYQQQR